MGGQTMANSIVPLPHFMRRGTKTSKDTHWKSNVKQPTSISVWKNHGKLAIHHCHNQFDAMAREVGSHKKCGSQRVQIVVWKGGFFTGKMCGFVWTQNGGNL